MGLINESDVNLNICNFDQAIVSLVLDEEEFPHRCGQEDRLVKEAWEGRGPAE